MTWGYPRCEIDRWPSGKDTSSALSIFKHDTEHHRAISALKQLQLPRMVYYLHEMHPYCWWFKMIQTYSKTINPNLKIPIFTFQVSILHFCRDRPYTFKWCVQHVLLVDLCWPRSPKMSTFLPDILSSMGQHMPKIMAPKRNHWYSVGHVSYEQFGWPYYMS